ncbi:MAG: hypothetical protein HOP04_06500 [Methylophilaceae bacterium]|nr:hypothetical protein [Methylophilaceae bacterium]
MQTTTNITPIAEIGTNATISGATSKYPRQPKSREGRLADHPAFADTVARIALGRLPGERRQDSTAGAVH